MVSAGAAKVVIIGGGVIGLGTAYHLAKLGIDDVLLIERNGLTSGTSWHATGIVGPLRASINLTKLAIYATELFGRLEAETGQGTGYVQTGGLWLAQSAARLTEIRRIAAMGEMTGLEVGVLDAHEIASKLPGLRIDDLAGALWVAADGQANPVDICMAYAKGARAGGVRIREGVGCASIEVENGAVRAVRLTSGETVRCAAVVNCAGVWSRAVGAMAGVPVPVQAVEHMYVVTEPIADLAEPFPMGVGLVWKIEVIDLVRFWCRDGRPKTAIRDNGPLQGRILSRRQGRAGEGGNAPHRQKRYDAVS